MASGDPNEQADPAASVDEGAHAEIQAPPFTNVNVTANDRTHVIHQHHIVKRRPVIQLSGRAEGEAAVVPDICDPGEPGEHHAADRQPVLGMAALLPAGADGALAFPAPLLRRITAAPADGLRLITISEDSMAPTLEQGDMVMVDTNRTSPSPPGIFVLDDGVGLVAKRVDAIPNTAPRMLRLSSDNPAYSNYQRRIDEVRVIGRVVWFARSL